MPPGKDDILLAELDLFVGVADAVLGGRAGRGDRIVDAQDAESGGQRCRGGRAHRLGDGQRPDAPGALVGAGDVGGLDHRAGGRPARAHDDPGARVLDVLFLEPGHGDGFGHGNVVPGRALGHETRRASVENGERIEGGRAMHLATEPVFDIVLGARNAGTRGLEAIENLRDSVPDRGNDPHSGDDNALHLCLLFSGPCQLA